MIIDISNAKTFPPEVEQIIINYIERLSQETISKIRERKVQYSNDVRCAIEDFLSPYKAELLYKELLGLMETHDMICYHSTKLLDKSNVLDNGLQPNEWNWYSQMLACTFRKLGLGQEDLNKAMDLVKHEYDRKYIEREPSLCFYSDLSLVSEGEHAGYEQFCENIGGELARWALKKKEPNIYRLLKENGEPVIVKFILPFSDVMWFRKESILYQFVSFVAGKYFWNYDYRMQFDGITRIMVAPDRIMEIISYERMVDY